MTEHTAARPAQQPEPRRARTRGLVVLVAAVLAVVLTAGGAFAAWQFFIGGGPRPAEVLPASTFALATVDLDPPGEQKVEAIKTLRTFPSWRKRTGVTADSDLRRSVFDLLVADGPCRTVDYDRDVAPWIGSRAGVGGVLLDGDPVPVLALQVEDQDKARAGFARLARCARADDQGPRDGLGWTLTEDYVVASDTAAHARAIVAAGQDAQLATDSEFSTWTDEAGGAGVMNFYLAPEAPEALEKLAAGRTGALGGLGGLGGAGALAGSQRGEEAASEGFEGAAGVVQFVEGGVELSVASSATATDAAAPTVAEQVEDLPADTGAVVALAASPTAIDRLFDSTPSDTGPGFGGWTWVLALVEQQTGLDLPEDLRTLLGESFTLALGGDAPADLTSIDELGDVPLGARVRGDADEIEKVVGKLRRSSAGASGDLHTQRSPTGDEVAVASTPAYAEQLLGEDLGADPDADAGSDLGGNLGGDEGFQQSVRHLSDAQALVYLDLDGNWGQRVTELLSQQDGSAQDLAGDLAVLRGLGATAWSDGTTSRALVRLAVRE